MHMRPDGLYPPLDGSMGGYVKDWSFFSYSSNADKILNAYVGANRKRYDPLNVMGGIDDQYGECYCTRSPTFWRDN